ncbi:MAG: propionyl-CoA carboxylase, partial [Planctomycetota bacterium]
MAKVILEPLGRNWQEYLTPEIYQEHLENMKKREEKILQEREKVSQGWGEKYEKRVHDKGKLTVYERIELLKDEGSTVYPLGTFVNHGLEYPIGNTLRTSPGAGVFTGFVKVSGKYVMVIANDNRVASGSWWPKTPEKIIRAQE